jgi:formate hydrogenlyase transcriptional activator
LRESVVEAHAPNHNGTLDEIARIIRQTISEISKENSKGEIKAHNESERQEIIRVLRETKGRVAGANGAAVRMAINRTTLISRIKKLGINPRLFF